MLLSDLLRSCVGLGDHLRFRCRTIRASAHSHCSPERRASITQSHARIALSAQRAVKSFRLDRLTVRSSPLRLVRCAVDRLPLVCFTFSSLLPRSFSGAIRRQQLPREAEIAAPSNYKNAFQRTLRRHRTLALLALVWIPHVARSHTLRMMKHKCSNNVHQNSFRSIAIAHARSALELQLDRESRPAAARG